MYLWFLYLFLRLWYEYAYEMNRWSVLQTVHFIIFYFEFCHTTQPSLTRVERDLLRAELGRRLPEFYFLGFGLLELPQWVLPELNGTYFVLNSAESCPSFYFLGFSLLELPNESSPSWTGRTSCWTQPNLTRVFIFWVLDFWNFPMIVERFCLNLEVWEILFWIN